MTTIIPARFLVRMCHPCRYVADMPRDDDASILELPESARLESFDAIDAAPRFADVRIAWNETGIGVTADVHGKDQPPTGDADRPRTSDGLSLWIDTRDARSGHRATRTCHQFHFLPAAGGSNRDEPLFVQTKIHRAQQDAPIVGAGEVPFRVIRRKSGYRLEAFLGTSVLTSFDPENHPRLGLFYALRDAELGEQTLSISADFPFAEDPSLWAVLELVRDG